MKILGSIDRREWEAVSTSVTCIVLVINSCCSMERLMDVSNIMHKESESS
jgi:ABC-type enterobactin transport system permease subunit